MTTNTSITNTSKTTKTTHYWLQAINEIICPLAHSHLYDFAFFPTSSSPSFRFRCLRDRFRLNKSSKEAVAKSLLPSPS
eukprot:m.5477 g.5477  ORF g.5477 m.5477 type:complete len:79 (-) comp2412_c0_seq1:1541-1777(-)